MLARQLKEALENKLLPKKIVDVETPVDKAVSILDSFLNVGSITHGHSNT